MKLLEFHARITKIKKNKYIQLQNNENHEIHRITKENHENHDNLNIPRKNKENHEIS